MERHELEGPLAELVLNVEDACKKIGLESIGSEKLALEAEMNGADFWNDQTHAQEVVGNYKRIKFLFDTWDEMQNETFALKEMFENIEHDDLAVFAEELRVVQEKYDHASFLLYFHSEYDKEPALMTITSGVGGDDAEDFAGMILRMFTMYFDKKGFEYELLEVAEGAGSDGLKKAVLEIRGPYAFGTLKGEKGVHRLVRLSPFKSSDSRQTSFIHVEILPLLKNFSKDQMEVEEKDIRVDTFRASGAGGQKVNKTDSAVRITHIPTGIAVACQAERSQHQNRERAMQILKAKLFQIQLQEQQKLNKELQGEIITQDWGKQIRSYVLHPYKMVKDHRTDIETAKVEDVFAGELDEFIDAEIKHGNLL